MRGNSEAYRWERAKALSGWVVAVILATSLFGVVSALSPSFSTVIQPGSMVLPSYVAFTDGTNYFMRNQKTGAIDSTSANPGTLLQAALTAVRAVGGGTLTIAPGNYSFTTSLYIGAYPQSLEIQGTPGSTILYSSTAGHFVFTSVNGAAVANAGDVFIHGVTVVNAGLWEGAGFRMKIYDNVIRTAANQDAIRFIPPTDGGRSVDNEVYSNWIRPGLDGVGIKVNQQATDVIMHDNIISLEAGSFGIYLDNAYGEQIVNNHIYAVQNGKDAILIRRTQDVTIVGNKIELATSVNFNYGIELRSDIGVPVRHVTISDNQIQLPVSIGSVGIKMTTTAGNPYPNNLVITGNLIWADPSYAFGFANTGILATSVTNSLISGNVFIGNFTTKITTPGYNTLVVGNLNYNPVGVLATPFDNTNNYVGLLGTSGTLTSAKVYRSVITPLTLYWTGGNVTAQAVNGAAIPFATTAANTVRLYPGETYSLTFSVTPTSFVVIGD